MLKVLKFFFSFPDADDLIKETFSFLTHQNLTVYMALKRMVNKKQISTKTIFDDARWETNGT